MLSEDFDKIYFVTCKRTCIRNTFLMEKTVANAKKNFLVKASQFQIGMDGNATDEPKPGRNTEFVFKYWNI